MAKAQAHGFGRRLHEPMLRGDLSAWLGWAPQRLTASEVLGGWRAALERRGTPGSPATVQLYAHFPICQSSCHFCQYFHVVPRESDQATRYADYLVALLGRYRDALGRVELSNAYFGGGTPTALPVAELARFADAFRRTFGVRGEFTCEAHPNTFDEEKLAVLRGAGVNRLSMGVQSFDPAVLKRIGRTNPPFERVAELVRRGRDAGMWTNTDLVLGLPGQTQASFHADLDRVLSEIGPDCVTVYRYQPNARMPDVPGDEMRYSRALSAAVLARGVRRGYLPATSGGDDRPGKYFFRNSRRTWGGWWTRLRFEALRLVRRDGELPVYALFENNESHMLGLGPGSISHLYGHSWHREVSAVGALSAAAEPVYLGTRMTAEDECRSALLQGLAETRWIDLGALRRRSGVDVEARFGAPLAAAVGAGALRRRGAWLAPARGVSPATHPALFEALLPDNPPDRASQAMAVSALRAAPDVQAELVAVDGDLLPIVDGDAAGDARQATPARSDIALLEWARLVGLGAPGETFGEATIERLGGGGEVSFRIEPPPAAALRVIVERDSGQRSFHRAGPYALSYAAAGRAALSPAEERFLRALCARTDEALRRAAARAAG